MNTETPILPTCQENDLIASITKESFFEFVKEFWDTIEQEELVLNWHMEYLCNELQELAEKVFKRETKKHDLIINIAPGSTKSTIASVMFPAWVWTVQPSLKSICASYVHSLALDLSRKTRDVIESDKYISCFKIKLRDDQNAKQYFMNTKGGTRFCAGVGGSVTGMHGHFLIVDDPLNPQEAVSEAELKKANSWMSETLPTRKVSKSVVPMILIMQRLHQDDPTGHLLEQGGEYKHICIPAEETDKIQPPELKKYYRDGLFDPARASKKVLDEHRLKMGEFGYAGQFLQHPVPLSGGMFKLERIVWDEPPLRFAQKVRYWDKAATTAKESMQSSFTVGALLAKDHHGRFWILDIVRGRWASDQREQVIKSTASIDGIGTIIGIEQEPGSGGKESAQSTVRNLAGYRVRVTRPTGDKAIRADPFSVQVNNGNVSGKIGMNWISDFVDELQFFPFSTYDDQVDACSGAFEILSQGKVRVGGLKSARARMTVGR